MVVILVLASIVVSSLLVSPLLILIQACVLVLLYYIGTRYAVHGGASSNDTLCGAFSVVAYGAFSSAYWDFGATL